MLEKRVHVQMWIIVYHQRIGNSNFSMNILMSHSVKTCVFCPTPNVFDEHIREEERLWEICRMLQYFENDKEISLTGWNN